MQYAAHISEFLNAFLTEPLKIGQMGQFYCSETMEYRMGDKYNSPMDDIYDACMDAEECQAFLLLGHRGCGKSTELNRMSERLVSAGCPVKTIYCSLDLDMLNIVSSDLFILMGEALLETADEYGCRLGRDVLDKIENFWTEGTQTVISQELEAVSAEAGISAETPKILANILNIFANIKSDLKYNEETRKEYRRQMNARSSEWVKLMSRVSEEIANKTGHLPVVIFEDLDRLDPENAWKVFYDYVSTLAGMSFPVIYTFPIALSYDARFAVMESYFTVKTLPMIKIETLQGRPFQDGIGVIWKIVEKRANPELFEPNVLKELILNTGGSLRELFRVINAAAKRAQRRQSGSICMEDAARALEEAKTSLTRRIEEKDYEFLINIYNGKKETIENKEMLIKMLQASVVLEYNGKRWHNVHPLVVQFFREQGKI